MLVLAGIGSLAIGFYDGIFGPGTGSFFIFSLSVFYKSIFYMLRRCQKSVIL